jgi:hypothetical protein
MDFHAGLMNRREETAMKRMLLAILMVGQPLSGGLVAEESCLRYEPAVAQLRGHVCLRTFPGPPNYESIKTGDRPERQVLLKLDEPVCILADSNDRTTSQDEHDQQLITVVPPVGMKLARYVGAHVRVEGTLFHAITAHHHTPVLVQMGRIARLAERPPGGTSRSSARCP